MTWDAVAKKEFQDAVRSKGLWLLALVFTTFFVVPPIAFLYFDIQFGQGTRDIGMQLLISQIYLTIVTFLLPIIAIFVGYAAITNERASGSLKLLLSLPHSRLDVVVGKVLGRCAVVAVPLMVAFAVTAVLLLAVDLTFKPALYGFFALFSMAFALVMVAIAVSISGAVRTNLQSLVANATFFMLVTFTWNSLANGFSDFLADTLGITSSANWNLILFLKLLNPSQAYKTLMNSVLGEGANAARSARYGLFGRGEPEMTTICSDVLAGSPSQVETIFGNQTVCEAGSRSMPLYFSDAAVFVYLLAWIGLAAVVSYYSFNRGDL